MMDELIEPINTYVPLNPEERNWLRQAVVKQSYRKHEVMFSEGQVAEELYFLVKGCVRLYYDVEGNDKTAFFYTEGKFICAGESYTFGVPARESYQAIEDTELYILTKPAIEKLLLASPKFEILARIAVEDELITYQRLLASFITKSAEQRYVEFLDTQGELFQRVPQQYIASFLGVSPETLSRIKARVHKKRLS
ncbi:MAG TPA: Crp/Fnr family transcriptional regulator [Cytophagales bacterium]|nr:Crp/Fnr family transcriptional regulator [Cytophagales bacterium]